MEFLKQSRFEQGSGRYMVIITPSEHYLFEGSLLASPQKYSHINIP